MAMMQVLSEVTGLVNEVLVTPGQQVSAGDTLVNMESMKMIMPMIAETAGVVCDVLVAEGDAVESGQVLVTMED